MKTKLLGGVVMLGLAPALAGFAQTVKAEALEASVQGEATLPTERRNRRVGIEEVVVTAQKREENIQDVPISLQAFSGDELDAKGISDPSELVAVTPGMMYNSIASFSIIYLRGVGTNVFTPSAAPSVATYVDGVFFPFSSQMAQSFGKLERIEVLKGPQGTLFGRNTTGGAISIVTAAPAEEFSGAVNLSVGSYAERRSKLFLTGPVTDSLSASFSAIYNTKDDYYDLAEESPLTELPDYEDKGFKGKVRWAPAEWVDWTLSYLDMRFDSPGSSVVFQQAVTPLGQATGTQNTKNDYEYSGNEEPFGKGNSEVLISTLSFFLDPFDIKWISGVQDHHNSQQIDFDGGPNENVAFRSFDGLVSDSKSNELQFLSNGEGWFTELFGRPVEWVAGLYLSNTTQGFDTVELEVLGISDLLSGGGVAGIPVPPLADILAQAGVAAPELGGTIQLSGLVHFNSKAAFTQVSWDLSEALSLTLGARYTQEDVKLTKPQSRFRPAGSTDDIILFDFGSRVLSEENLSPKVSVEYRPAENFLIFASWQEGFKSGTFNIINIYTEPDEIQPEKITAFELGVKTEWFDQSLRLNAAVFDYSIEDYQALTVSIQSGGAVNIENAAEVAIRGAEFDLSWSITPDLIFSAGGSYLDSEFSSYPNGSGFDPDTGLFSEGLDFSGNTPPQTAEFSGNIGLFYTLDVWRGVMEAGVDGYYNSGYFFDNQNEAENDAYYTVGARLGYLYDPLNLRVTAFGNNLTDEKYFFVKFPFDFGTVAKLGEPRTYGVRLDWEF